MEVAFDLNSVDSYRLFLKIKTLPRYRISGRTAIIPDEYASLLGRKTARKTRFDFTPPEWMFDYQRDITSICIRKKKFAVFAECGLGKSNIFLEYARHVSNIMPNRSVLIVSPLMVVKQTMKEAGQFFGDKLAIEQIAARDLPLWMRTGTGIGITNYEAITDGLEPGKIGCLIADESSMFKGVYGKWGTKLIDLGRGLEWKLALTGTPAPNDRIEFANHAVFLDRFPTVNSFLARYFVNRGQTNNRWELKPWATSQFYRDMSDWCIFLQNPATYGWKDNAGTIPPINLHIHDVPMTEEQKEAVRKLNGDMFGTPGGITSRAKLGQIAKGFSAVSRIDPDSEEGDYLAPEHVQLPTNKPEFIRKMIASWPTESTIVWCLYNNEQDALAKHLGAASISGSTPYEDRVRIIEDFQSKRIPTIVTKGKILGFGQNLQVCTRQVFSGIADSWELFHQCVKRSNRVGSTLPLNVHIPLTEVERPMVETILTKADRIDKDTAEQESIYRKCGVIDLLMERKVEIVA